MKTRVWLGIVVLVVVALVAIGVASADTLFGRQETGPGPEEAVEAFYNAYLAYSERGNPMVDRAYRDMPGLATEFVAEMDALFEAGPVYFDPFLCAQDVPMSVSVTQPYVEGREAMVEVATLWYGNPMASLLTVELAEQGGEWEITGIRCDGGRQRPLEAGETVEAFYAIYLDRAARENPLVTGSYAHMPFLSAEFVAEVSETLANMQGSGYDPILLAQDVPMWVKVEHQHFEGNRATVTVATSFEGHRLDVELVQRNGAWEIIEVARAD
jgi:hypothetical protein